MLPKFMLPAGVLLLLTGCQAHNASDADTLSGSSTQLSVAFTDFNPESARAKMSVALDRLSQASSTESSQDCELADGQRIPNYEADATADGTAVFYCKDGIAMPAQENRFIKDLLIEAGATSEELKDVKTYLVPSPIANAWAMSPKKGRGHLVVYQGIMMHTPLEPSFKPITDDGALAGVLVHELGHIVDSRKSGFTNLKDREESLAKFCRVQRGKAQNFTQRDAIKETCFLRMQAQTRAYEYSADNNITITFKRRLPKLTLNPYKVVEWQEAQDARRTNARSSHPADAERGFYLRKAFDEAGFPKDIPPRNSTVKALAGSLAD